MSKKRNAKPTEPKTRTVTIPVAHPISVTLTVRPSSDDDWQIVSVRDWTASVTARSVMENMTGQELMELDRLANAAKDDE